MEQGFKLPAKKTNVVVLTWQMNFSEHFTVEVDAVKIEAVTLFRYLEQFLKDK